MPENAALTSLHLVLVPACFALFAGAVVGLAVLLGAADGWRARARRWRAALDAYADREIARARSRRLARLERLLARRRDPSQSRPTAGVGRSDRQPRLTQGGTAVLVLSRRVGEQILIPQYDVSVRVVAVKGNTVRLAITAPPEVGVWREELWDRSRHPVAAGRLGGPMTGSED